MTALPPSGFLPTRGRGLAALLIWYRQRPEYLGRLLASLCGRVECVVAADGPFRGLSDVVESSPDEYGVFGLYRDVLRIVLLRARVWDSEAHKRTAVAVEARRLGMRHGLVIDSDEALLGDVGGPYARLYQDGRPTARMRRIYPLTESIRWGPHHATVQDDTRIYWHYTDDTSPTAECQTAVLHTPGDKLIQREYDAYNASVRGKLEGTK